MANSLLTIDMVTREALRVAHEKLTFISTIDRSYDDSYAKTGAKIGSSLRVRLPNQYTVRSGRTMDVQHQTEASSTVTMATQKGVDMEFDSVDLALSIDDFSKRYIEPAMSRLAAEVENDVITDAIKATYQTVGTPGTVVGASGDISALHLARAKLNQQLAPKDMNRSAQLDSVTMATVANGIKSLFHDAKEIKQAFTEGFIARTAMADFYENEKTWTLTNSSDVTANTNADALVTDGGSTIAVGDDLAIGVQTVGSVFTIAGVYDVHPETKAAYSHLKQFTITATGAVSVTVSPAIHLTGAKKNVASSTGADLAVTDFNEKALTFHGSASTSYRQNLMYHKDAFTFVTADLPIQDDAHRCVRRVQDGLSMRVWEASDIINDRRLMRLDILYGYKALRPEWACRISN